MKQEAMGVPVAARLLRSVFSRRAVDGLLCNPTSAAGVFFYVIHARAQVSGGAAEIAGVLEHVRTQLEHEYGMTWTAERVQEVFDRLVAGGWIAVYGNASCGLMKAAYELGWMTSNRGKPGPVEKVEPHGGSFLDMMDPQVQAMARELIGRTVLGQRHLKGSEQNPIGGVSIRLDTWHDDADPVVIVEACGVLKWQSQPVKWHAYLRDLQPYGLGLCPPGRLYVPRHMAYLANETYADVLVALVKRADDPAASWGEYEETVKHRQHTAVVRAAVRQVLEARAATGQGLAPLSVLYVATCMQFVEGDPTAPKDAAHVLEALGELVSGGVASYGTVDSHHAWMLKPDQG